MVVFPGTCNVLERSYLGEANMGEVPDISILRFCWPGSSIAVRALGLAIPLSHFSFLCDTMERISTTPDGRSALWFLKLEWNLSIHSYKSPKSVSLHQGLSELCWASP